MAYQTGTATDPNDLLQKLVTFLAANGWTTDQSAVDGTGWRYHAHRGSVFANIKSTVGNVNPWAHALNIAGSATSGGLHLYLGTGFNGANNWNAQAGGPIGSGQTYTLGASLCLTSGAITAYHFFTHDSGDSVFVLVEKSTGLFLHMAFGVSLVKAGTWTGGPYFAGSCAGTNYTSTTANSPGITQTTYAPFFHNDFNGSNCGFVRVDVDAFTGKWIAMGSNTSAQFGYTGKLMASVLVGGSGAPPTDIATYTDLSQRLYSVMNGQSILFPPRLYAQRDAGGYSLIGTPPNVFYTAGTLNGVAAGTEIALGPDTYMLFPGPNISGTQQRCGYAIKKVA